MSEPEWRKLLADGKVTVPLLVLVVVIAVLITWMVAR